MKTVSFVDFMRDMIAKIREGCHPKIE